MPSSIVLQIRELRRKARHPNRRPCSEALPRRNTRMAAFRTREIDERESSSGSAGSEASRPQDTDAPLTETSSAPSLPILPLGAAAALLLVLAAVIAVVLLGKGGSDSPQVGPP